MARLGVTYQDIASAAQTLKGQGKSVTIENVRGILGTGSIGTINNHLRKWKETQSATQSIAAKENLPPELVSLMKGLWERLLVQSTEQFIPIEEKLKQEIAELIEDRDKFKTNNTRWQKLFDQWQQEKAQLANDKLMLEQALEFAHKEQTALIAKNDTLIQQLQDKQDRVDELHRLHKQVQENLEHYRESAREQRILDQQQYEQQKQQREAEIKTLNEQSSVLRDKFNNLQREHTLIHQSYHALEKSHADMQKQMEKISAQREEAVEAKNRYQHDSLHWQQQYNELQKIHQEKTQSYTDMQTDLKLLSQQLKDIKQTLVEAKDQNKLLANDKWILAQEKSQLEGQLKQMQKMIIA